jgi:hypothetical protein
LTFVLLVVPLLLLGSAPPEIDEMITTTGVDGISAGADRGSLHPPAALRITPSEVPGLDGGVWPSAVPVGRPVKIEPDPAGALVGEATLAFPYPDRLPDGLEPEDLMVTTFVPELNARLPVPFSVDRERQRLVVVTDHLSEWQLGAPNPAVAKSVNDFVLSAAQPSRNRRDSPFEKWLDRLYPTYTPPTCADDSELLDIEVVDHGNPFSAPACYQEGTIPGTALLKFVNTHHYPMVVHLPQGVSVAREVSSGESFEEVMTQLVASYLGADEFVLRGGGSVNLVVRPDELEPGAEITADVDATVLLSDVLFWTLDMGVDQRGAKWDVLRKYQKTHGSLQTLTDCFKGEVNARRALNHSKPKNAEEKKAQQAEFGKILHDAIRKCAVPAAKEVHGLWERVRRGGAQAAKGVVDATLPAARMIDRFRLLWNNPVVLTEWTEGLIAGVQPGDVSTVKVLLGKRESRDMAALDGSHHVFLKAVDENSGLVTFDAVQWFTGADAVRQCREQGVQPGGAWCANYYYRNVSTALKTLPAKAASIGVLSDRTREVPGTLADVKAEVLSHPGAHFVIKVADARIVDLRQVFVP